MMRGSFSFFISSIASSIFFLGTILVACKKTISSLAISKSFLQFLVQASSWFSLRLKSKQSEITRDFMPDLCLSSCWAIEFMVRWVINGLLGGKKRLKNSKQWDFKYLSRSHQKSWFLEIAGILNSVMTRSRATAAGKRIGRLKTFEIISLSI